MSRDPYEKCTICGGSGTRPGAKLYPLPPCPGCRGEKYIAIGLTVAQVDRPVVEERRRKGDPAAGPPIEEGGST